MRVEDAALAWLESLWYTVKHGPEIAAGELFAERADYGQVLPVDRGRQLLQKVQQFRWIVSQGTVSGKEIVGR